MSLDDASYNDWNTAYNNVVQKPAVVQTLGDYINSKQVSGTHYKGTKVQPWDVFLDWGLDPWACNVLKYTQRHRKKAGKEDLEKAKHYLEFMIANYDAIGEKYYK
jgi:hypothetical protein